MKNVEKELVRNLRREGLSLKEITKKVGVAKSSVSLWVKDIELTIDQKRKLTQNGTSVEVVEKRRSTRIIKEENKRQIIKDEAELDIENISKKNLFYIGVSLYWAEGSKTRRGIVEFSNGDPRLIKIMMKFFKEICDIPKEKFRGHIHLHPHLNTKKAELYWHSISKIPISQFFKTSKQQSKASQNKKDSLPFGTFSIYVCKTELFLKIMGWINGLTKRIGS